MEMYEDHKCPFCNELRFYQIRTSSRFKHFSCGNCGCKRKVAIPSQKKNRTKTEPCQHCYGKGYSTQLVNIHVGSDFGSGAIDKMEEQIHYCSCAKGQEMEKDYKRNHQ